MRWHSAHDAASWRPRPSRTTVRGHVARSGVAAACVLALAAGLLPSTRAHPATASTTAPTSSEPPALRVGPSSQRLTYQGRWDITARHSVTVNSGSRVALRYTGKSVVALFDTKGITEDAQIYAYVDGAKSAPIVIDRDRITVTSPGLAPGRHTLVLAVKDVSENGARWKRPFTSALRFRGFVLPGATAVRQAARVPDLKFTFLGDSITQGVAVDCLFSVDTASTSATPSVPKPFGTNCADGTKDYAYRVAAAFGAGLEQVGFGAQGITVPGNGGVPPASQTLNLNFAGSRASRWPADLVVVNQGTNDIASPADDLRAGYVRYLRQVLQRYPEATVIALEPFGLSGLLTFDISPALRDAVTTIGDRRLRFVSTRGWLGPLDFTDQVHPTASGHARAARRLVTVISRLSRG